MTGRQLIETDIDLIETQIKSNIATALADVRTQRADPTVSTEPPNGYYIYEKSQAYRCPAVFIIGDRIDFKKLEKQANFIDAVSRINVTVLIEDKDAERLTIKAWRYQAALHEVLDQVQLTSADSRVKITIVVMNASFSPLYSLTQDPTAANAIFRKEVVLECDVHHYEANN